MKKHNLKWFEKRIGKEVYRFTPSIGIKVQSKIHAKALEMYQNDLNVYYAEKPLKK